MPKKTNNTKLPKIKKLPSGSFHCKVYSHTDESGKLVYESFTNPDYNALVYEVAEFKRDREREKKGGKASGETFRDACRKYNELKGNTLSPSTLRSYIGMTEKSMHTLMGKRLSDITAEDVQREINQLAKDHAPKTVRNHHGFVSVVLATYRPDLKLNTTLPQKEKPDISIPTEEEIRKMFEQVKGTEMEIPIALGALCGMRMSEIVGLKWSSVNLKKGTLTVKEAMVRGTNNQIVNKVTKTTAGKRTIRLFPMILETLQSAPQDTDHVVNLTANAIKNRFFRMLEKNDIKHYRFHDLRHYCVSVMLSLNVPKAYIASYVGHETERMIDMVYGHIMASKKTSVEDQLQEYYEDVFGEKTH